MLSRMTLLAKAYEDVATRRLYPPFVAVHVLLGCCGAAVHVFSMILSQQSFSEALSWSFERLKRLVTLDMISLYARSTASAFWSVSSAALTIVLKRFCCAAVTIRSRYVGCPCMSPAR